MWPFQGSFIKPDKLKCQGKLASTILVDAAVLCNHTSPTAADLKDVTKIQSLWFNYRYIYTCRPCIYTKIPLL
jgi:hypothetical protein